MIKKKNKLVQFKNEYGNECIWQNVGDNLGPIYVKEVDKQS